MSITFDTRALVRRLDAEGPPPFFEELDGVEFFDLDQYGVGQIREAWLRAPEHASVTELLEPSLHQKTLALMWWTLCAWGVFEGGDDVSVCGDMEVTSDLVVAGDLVVDGDLLTHPEQPVHIIVLGDLIVRGDFLERGRIRTFVGGDFVVSSSYGTPRLEQLYMRVGIPWSMLVVQGSCDIRKAMFTGSLLFVGAMMACPTLVFPRLGSYMAVLGQLVCIGVRGPRPGEESWCARAPWYEAMGHEALRFGSAEEWFEVDVPGSHEEVLRYLDDGFVEQIQLNDTVTQWFNDETGIFVLLWRLDPHRVFAPRYIQRYENRLNTH